eukprot:jgi/Ulvmu1/10765/UM068_0055.1
MLTAQAERIRHELMSETREAQLLPGHTLLHPCQAFVRAAARLRVMHLASLAKLCCRARLCGLFCLPDRDNGRAFTDWPHSRLSSYAEVPLSRSHWQGHIALYKIPEWMGDVLRVEESG